MALPFELKTTRGRLTTRIFENMNVGIMPTLFYDINISLEKFKYDGEQVDTAIRLDFIVLPVDHWREIGEQSFTFPVNPDDGYIDGSMYLANVHNPVDCTRITFSNWTDSTVTASLDLLFNFTYEGPKELGKVKLNTTVVLDFDKDSLDKIEKEYEPIRLHPEKHVDLKQIVSQLAQLKDPSSISPLIELLDDEIDDDELKLSIVKTIEMFDNAIYMDAFVASLPKQVKSSMRWAIILHTRIMNSPKTFEEYLRRLSKGKKREKKAARNVLDALIKIHPEYQDRVDIAIKAI